MKRLLAVVGVLATASLVRGQPAKKVMAPEDIKDCSYWAAQMKKAEQCAKRNSTHRKESMVLMHEGHCAVPGCAREDVGTEKPSSTAGTYDAASRLCKDAVTQYRAEMGKCEARKQMGATAQNARPTPPSQEALKALEELSKALNEFGRHQTQQGISAIKNALQKLHDTGYQGAGIQIEDHGLLESLGLSFIDVSQVGNLEGNWDVGPYYGYPWDQPPTFPPRVKDHAHYCDIWKKQDYKNCKKRCDYHFYERPDTAGGKAYAKKFERCGGHSGCMKWCIQEADLQFKRCGKNDMVMRDSASNLTLVNSKEGGYYSYGPHCVR